MKNQIFTIVYVSFLTLAVAFIAYESWGNAIGYDHTVNKITEKLHIEGNIKTSGKKLLEKITFNWYDGYTQDMEELKALKLKSEQYDKNAYRFIKAFFGVVLLSIILYFIARKRAQMTAMIFISIIALIAGWFSPILEITAYQEVPLLGNTIFQYESKSIISALYKIFEKQQYAIAIVILLFTIVTPVIKSIILLLINYKSQLKLSDKSTYFLGMIGKWSMLDVFVVAIIVTYFSMKTAGQTDANLQIGVYYFCIYVILSMVCTFIVTYKGSSKDPVEAA